MLTKAQSCCCLEGNKQMSVFVLTKLVVALQADQNEILVTISLKLPKYNLTSDNEGGRNL